MLYLVCGYPASGKSIYCRQCVQQSAGRSIVFDMDAMRQAITCTGAHDQRMSRSIGRLLNDTAALFSTMYRQYGIENMYLIRMAQREDELEHLARVDDMRVVFMDVPKEICRARAELRGDYDLYAFGRACGIVDKFLYAHKEICTLVQPQT